MVFQRTFRWKKDVRQIRLSALMSFYRARDDFVMGLCDAIEALILFAKKVGENNLGGDLVDTNLFRGTRILGPNYNTVLVKCLVKWFISAASISLQSRHMWQHLAGRKTTHT